MGMADTIVVLDEVPSLSCPAGHALRSFRTKDLDLPSMATYLLRGGRLFLASNDDLRGCEQESDWRIQGDVAIREARYLLREIVPQRIVRAYGECDECDPILVRSDHPTVLGDIVDEHKLFVDFILMFRAGEPVRIERESGSRDELRDELSRRGVYVLEDDEPLAIAHRELQRARSRRGGARRVRL